MRPVRRLPVRDLPWEQTDRRGGAQAYFLYGNFTYPSLLYLISLKYFGIISMNLRIQECSNTWSIKNLNYPQVISVFWLKS